jgi:hypothetical protein
MALQDKLLTQTQEYKPSSGSAQQENFNPMMNIALYNCLSRLKKQNKLKRVPDVIPNFK